MKAPRRSGSTLRSPGWRLLLCISLSVSLSVGLCLNAMAGCTPGGAPPGAPAEDDHQVSSRRVSFGAPGATAHLPGEGYPWLYRRDQADPSAGAQVVELVAVGDVMLGRGVRLEQDPLGSAAPWLRAADLALGNLESPLAPPGAALPDITPSPGAGAQSGENQPYDLVAPAGASGALQQAGFDLLGIANNHALDRGLAGLEDTSVLLAHSGLTVLGAGENRAAAYQPVYREVDGVRLAFLAVNAVAIPRGAQWSGEVRQAAPDGAWSLAGWDAQAALAAVSQAHQQADTVIVSIHWGYEYETRVDAGQRQIAKRLVEAGADLVVGHHPHVVQKTELLTGQGGEAVVAYSLGNFVFDQGFEQTGDGLALQAYFDEQGLRGVRALPVQAGTRPTLLPAARAAALLERIQPEPIQAAFRCSADGCAPAGSPGLIVGGGIFTSGQVDLRGSGQPETLSLQDGRVQITKDGRQLWISPQQWTVHDVAPGDPNRDGRQELVLALSKADSSGVVLSHPYVLGYRQGEYRLLWGGSAVSEPILEIELLDLDGDGQQELAVLEEAPTQAAGDPARTVSLWRWNGWGFSRVWRSEPGSYTDLRSIVTTANAWIVVNQN